MGKIPRRRYNFDVFVPGHGFVERSAILEEELQTFREAIERVIAEATRLHGDGLDSEAAGEAANFGELETWSLRSSQGARAIAKVYEELNVELP